MHAWGACGTLLSAPCETRRSPVEGEVRRAATVTDAAGGVAATHGLLMMNAV